MNADQTHLPGSWPSKNSFHESGPSNGCWPATSTVDPKAPTSGPVLPVPPPVPLPISAVADGLSGLLGTGEGGMLMVAGSTSTGGPPDSKRVI